VQEYNRKRRKKGREREEGRRKERENNIIQYNIIVQKIYMQLN